MAGPGVLFVVRSFSGTGAQPIRFRQIISHLKEEYDIHVLELTHGNKGVREEDGITIHSLAYTRIGKIFNPPNRGLSGVKGRSGSSGSIITPFGLSFSAAPAGRASGSRRLAVLKRHVRSLFFPDSVVTEGARLSREAVSLTRKYGFRVVVLSAFPFTVLRIAKALKMLTGTRVILDVGDPFYRNSRNGFLRDLMARSFEAKHLRFIDSLVVTNEMTRNHYINTFLHPGPEAVHVIPMGISESMATGLSGKPVHNAGTSPGYPSGDPFTLVYAGQLYRKMREPFALYQAVKELNSEAGVKVLLQMYGSFSREFSSGNEEDEMISFMGQIPHNKITEAYSNAGGVVFIDNAYGMQTPGKVFEVALIHKPVLFIADRSESPALEVVKGLKHIVITANQSELITAAIRKIMVMEPEYPSPEMVQRFLWENRAQQYKQIINQLTGE